MPLPHPQPEPKPAATTMPGPSLELDLAREIESLHQAEAWKPGISRKTLLRYPDFRITLTALRAGTRIEPHYNPGRISVHTLAGHIRMHALDKLFDLPQGRMLTLDRSVAHDVEAVEDSVFLLTVARPESLT